MNRINGFEEDTLGVGAAIAEYLERSDAGEAVDQNDFLAAHPQVAEGLREFFTAENLISELAGPTYAQQNESAAARNTAQSQADVTIPDAAAHQPRPGELSRDSMPFQLGRYEIREQIGRGAMGTVYLARDTILGRDVALKIPLLDAAEGRDELIERFHREARTAGALRHPGICPVYDVDQVHGVHLIAMAYLSGQTLAERMGAGGLSERQAAGLIRDIAAALDAAHRQGIIHRDIKPSNIMIDEAGQPVVMDFGLSVRYDADDIRVTKPGTVLGTPAYVSPEQIGEHSGEAGPQSDMYSLGVVLYELLTGRLPFTGTVAHVMHQIVHATPKPISAMQPAVNPELEAICLRMLQKQPEARFESMRQLIDVLDAMLDRPAAPTRAVETGVCSGTNSDPDIVNRIPRESDSARSQSATTDSCESPPQPTATSGGGGGAKNWTSPLLMLIGFSGAVTLATAEANLSVESYAKDVQISVSQETDAFTCIDTQSGSRLDRLSDGRYQLDLDPRCNSVEINGDRTVMNRNGLPIAEIHYSQRNPCSHEVQHPAAGQPTESNAAKGGGTDASDSVVVAQASGTSARLPRRIEI